jgi:(p)ppGpp synthase/HD superfamily hydrolase
LNMKRLKLLEKAIKYAEKMHRGQYRRRSSLPYITHPIRVMSLLSRWGIDSEVMLTAAILHDIVEDTKGTLEDIEDKFTKEISELVDVLTHRDTETSKEYRQRIRDSKNVAAMVIKIADRISNYDDFMSEGREDSAKPYLEKIFPIIDYVFSNSYKVDDQVMVNMGVDIRKRGYVD